MATPPSIYQAGDAVWLRVQVLPGPNRKLAAKWEEATVIRQLHAMVYDVRRVGARGSRQKHVRRVNVDCLKPRRTHESQPPDDSSAPTETTKPDDQPFHGFDPAQLPPPERNKIRPTRRRTRATSMRTSTLTSTSSRHFRWRPSPCLFLKWRSWPPSAPTSSLSAGSRAWSTRSRCPTTSISTCSNPGFGKDTPLSSPGPRTTWRRAPLPLHRHRRRQQLPARRRHLQPSPDGQHHPSRGQKGPDSG